MLPLARLGMGLAQRLDARFMLPGNVSRIAVNFEPDVVLTD